MEFFSMLWSLPGYGPLMCLLMIGLIIFFACLILGDVIMVSGRSSFLHFTFHGAMYTGLLLMFAPLGVLTVMLAAEVKADSGLGIKGWLVTIAMAALCIVMSAVSISGIIDFTKNIPYIIHPLLVQLSSCELYEQETNDSTDYRISGLDETGDRYDFQLEHQEWKRAKELLEKIGQNRFHVNVTYLPKENIVVDFKTEDANGIPDHQKD
ncbi:MAG: hypothetical protein SOI44_04925 [Lactimicrobium sp.]|jgi:TM2 domain-containing membrane protein YozV|uniref:hypothetical protein n=1 Tax=Lactimicrobium sp. TaxID=2563780 RepID=UPI002F35BFCD